METPAGDYVTIPGVTYPLDNEVPDNAIPVIPRPPALTPINLPADSARFTPAPQDPNAPADPTPTRPPEVTPLPRDSAAHPTHQDAVPEKPDTPILPTKYATTPNPEALGAPHKPAAPQLNPHSLDHNPQDSGVPNIGGLPPLTPAAPPKKQVERRSLVRATMGEKPNKKRKNRPEEQPPPPPPPQPAAEPPPAPTPAPPTPAAAPKPRKRAQPATPAIREHFIVRRDGEDAGPIGAEGERVKPVQRARAWVQSLRQKYSWLTEDLVDTSNLLVSETAANSLRWTMDEVAVNFTVTDTDDVRNIRFTVTDKSPVVPENTDMPDWDAERGRGGPLVEMLSDAHGTTVQGDGTGKSTWFELHQPHGGASGHSNPPTAPDNNPGTPDATPTTAPSTPTPTDVSSNDSATRDDPAQARAGDQTSEDADATAAIPHEQGTTNSPADGQQAADQELIRRYVEAVLAFHRARFRAAMQPQQGPRVGFWHPSLAEQQTTDNEQTTDDNNNTTPTTPDGRIGFWHPNMKAADVTLATIDQTFAKKVRDALADLPDSEMAERLVELVLLQNASLDEAAAELHIDDATARNMLGQVISALAPVLDPPAADTDKPEPDSTTPEDAPAPEHPEQEAVDPRQAWLAQRVADELAGLPSPDPATKADLTPEQSAQLTAAAKLGRALYRLRKKELAAESWAQRRRVMENGDDVESLLRYIDAMRAGTGMTPRWNQIKAFLVQGFLRQMGTGQGKSIVGSLDGMWQLSRGKPVQLPSGRWARVHHVITTTETLANEGVRQFEPMLRSLGYRAARWDPHNPSPEPEEPTVYYMTYDERATAKLFNNSPPGVTATIDEADAVLVHNQTVHYLSDGQREPALEEESAGVYRVRDFLKGVLKDRVLTSADLRADREASLVTASRLWEEHAGRAFTTEEVNMAGAFLDLKAGRLKLNRDFQKFDGKIQILDEYGKPRSDPKVGTDSRWFGGRHKMLEAMFGVQVYSDGKGLKQVTVEDVLGDYESLNLMSGTLEGTAEEIKQNFAVQGGLAKIEDFGKSKRVGEEDRIFLTVPEKLKDALARVQQLQAEGRPVLVISPFNDLAVQFSLMLTKAGVEHNAIVSRWFAEHRDNNAAEENLLGIKDKAGARSAVTVGTGMLGRGFDVSITDEVNELGGVHAQMLGRSLHNPDEDHQWSGRAGRKGRNGSYGFNVAVTDLKDAAQHPIWQVAVSHFRTAVAKHTKATDQYAKAAGQASEQQGAQPAEADSEVLQAAKEIVDAAAAEVELAAQGIRILTPVFQSVAAQHAYLGRAQQRANRANAPPGGGDSATPPTNAPVPDDEWTAIIAQLFGVSGEEVDKLAQQLTKNATATELSQPTEPTNSSERAAPAATETKSAAQPPASSSVRPAAGTGSSGTSGTPTDGNGGSSGGNSSNGGSSSGSGSSNGDPVGPGSPGGPGNNGGSTGSSTGGDRNGTGNGRSSGTGDSGSSTTSGTGGSSGSSNDSGSSNGSGSAGNTDGSTGGNNGGGNSNNGGINNNGGNNGSGSGNPPSSSTTAAVSGSLADADADADLTRQIMECVAFVFHATRALGVNDGREPKKDEQDILTLEAAVITQLIKVQRRHPAENSTKNDPLGWITDNIKKKVGGADTAVIVVGQGNTKHAYVITNVSGQILVFDSLAHTTVIDSDTDEKIKAPGVRHYDDWTPSYENATEAFVAYLKYENDELAPLFEPLPDENRTIALGPITGSPENPEPEPAAPLSDTDRARADLARALGVDPELLTLPGSVRQVIDQLQVELRLLDDEGLSRVHAEEFPDWLGRALSREYRAQHYMVEQPTPEQLTQLQIDAIQLEADLPGLLGVEQLASGWAPATSDDPLHELRRLAMRADAPQEIVDLVDAAARFSD